MNRNKMLTWLLNLSLVSLISLSWSSWIAFTSGALTNLLFQSVKLRRDHGPGCLYEALRNQSIINLSSLLNSACAPWDADGQCSYFCKYPLLSLPPHLSLRAKWLQTLDISGSGTKSPVQKELPGADTHFPHTSGLPERMMEFSASFPVKIVSSHRKQ